LICLASASSSSGVASLENISFKWGFSAPWQ
jgi:hypothetical protein